MQCKNCRTELETGSIFCPECGTPVMQTVEGFESTLQILRQLKLLIDQNGRKVVGNPGRFTALLADYLPDYDKERRLLIYIMRAGILKNMALSDDRHIAAMIARSNIVKDCFVTENAAEFVIVCFSYVLGWEYEPPEPKEEPAETEAQEQPEQPQETAPKDEHRAGPLSIESKVLRPSEAAVKFRFSKNVVVPEGVTKIDSFCFDGFSGMKTITLPSTIMAIGDYAFSGCKHLKGIELPETLKVLNQGAFNECYDLTVIKIPSGILEIGDNTFLCCNSLEVVDIPPTVSSIGAQAFSGCGKLRKLFIPESVKYIDDNAFLYCPELTIHCFENSYVHKYCLNKGIKFETVITGADLHSNPGEGGQI